MKIKMSWLITILLVVVLIWQAIELNSQISSEDAETVRWAINFGNHLMFAGWAAGGFAAVCYVLWGDKIKKIFNL